jgi:hypothetical protein
MTNHPARINDMMPLFTCTMLVDDLNQQNPLIMIAKAIDWDLLERQLSHFFNDKIGRPALPIRLMAGLLLLQRIQPQRRADGQELEGKYLFPGVHRRHTILHGFPVPSVHDDAIRKRRQGRVLHHLQRDG